MIDNPRREAPTPAQAQRAAEAEYATLLGMLAGLGQAHWDASTECAPWTVRDMVAHLSGASEEAVRLRVQLRHLRYAKKHLAQQGFVDALNEQQIADRAGLAPDDLLAELSALAGRAPASRRRTPGFIRRRPLPPEAGGLVGDTMAHLIDVIYTRDIWMHRVDISRATGCPLPDSGVEGEIVGLIVRDLGRDWHGAPFTLTLTGRVPGQWSIGGRHPDAPEIVVDCVAACRLWSGRSDETGLSRDSANADALLETRILF